MPALKTSVDPRREQQFSRTNRTQCIELLLILAVFFIVGGAPAPHVNESHYLAKVKHYWDPSFCPGDFFLDSADPHLTFYWTVGWLTKWLSLPATAWIGRVAAWMLLAVGWQRLSRSAIDLPWAAPLSAALWVILIERANFAGEWVVGGVEAKCFAYGFLLLGLAALARRRWTTPWMWFGLAATMHVLVGAWAVLAALAVWVSEPRASRPSPWKLLPGLVTGGLLSLPGLLPALALERGVDPATVIEASRIYVFERLPHHLAPLALEADELALKLARFGLLSAAFVALWAWSRQRPAISPAPAAAAATLAGSPPASLERIMRFAAFALAANALGLCLEAALTQYPNAAARVLRYYWFRQADVALPLAVSLAGTSLALTLLRHPSRWLLAAGLAPAVWCVGELSIAALGRWQKPRPPADARIADGHIENFEAWRDACEWIDTHAPTDARFLIPRAGQSFKWYAARADVANWKDVPQDAAGVVEWRRRCQELFPTVNRYGKEKILDSPEKLGTERVRQLALKYGATHVLAHADPPLDLPLAYSNVALGEDAFAVYEVSNAAVEESP